MRLIGLAVVLAVGLALAPLAAEAQTAANVYRVGYIGPTPVANIVSDPTHPFNSGFLREMRQRGYVEGRNFALGYRSVAGSPERDSEVVVNWSASKWTSSLRWPRRQFKPPS